MNKIILSVCSRDKNRPESLKTLVNYGVPGVLQTRISWDAPSIYDGHKLNALMLEDDNDVIVMCHDDVEILTRHDNFYNILELCKKPATGFVGPAGTTMYDNLSTGGAWWNARNFGATRGFVFQGRSNESMRPNWFGPYGQVVALDGCFLACSFRTLKTVGLDKPHYLESNWDFYDIYLTLKAHFQGLNNYAVPIIIRHESDGQMREGWFKAKDQFLKYNAGNIPVRISFDKTNGLPK